MKDFTNIMDQSKQFPLYIDLALFAQGKVIETLAGTDVSEDRRHDRQTPCIDLPAVRRVDLLLHGFDQVGFLTGRLHRERAIL